MIGLPTYAKIKNRYCICYFGPCNEYIVQLLYLRPHVEAVLPGLDLYIGCQDSLHNFAKHYDKILLQNEINDKKREFAYIRVVKCNMVDHPIENILKESNIEYPSPVIPHKSSNCTKCIIYPKGNLPTRSLTNETLDKLIPYCTSKGYQVQIEGNIDEADWVVGVENEQLFLAGFKGIKTSLIPTGVGTNFYQKLFKGEILTI